jgi:hypothetical protein
MEHKTDQMRGKGNGGTRNTRQKWETETILFSDKFNSGTLGRNGVNRRAINEVRYINIFVVGCEWWIGLIWHSILTISGTSGKR